MNNEKMKLIKFTFFLLIILISQSSFGLKPDSTYYYKPNMFGLMYQEYKVKTSDDYSLNMWFYPAQDALSNDSIRYYIKNKTEVRPYEVTEEKKATIIICNGDASNMSQLLSPAYIFCTNGFNVITFDWRGFGESQYFPIDTNYLVYSEFLIDYNAIVDYTKQMKSVNSNKIGVFGFSTGAFMSFAIATEREEIKAIVARGIFTDYESLRNDLMKINPNDTYFTKENIDDISPRNNWDSFYKPIFLIVGENDNRTPKENSIEIISNVKSSIRELWIVKKASHGGALAPEIIENDIFIKKTTRFFNENL
jgi:pimeloyl-ACP methyl ester carboxylesterase